MSRLTLLTAAAFAVTILGACDSGGAKPSPSPSATPALAEPTAQASDPPIVTYIPPPPSPAPPSAAAASPAAEDPLRKAVQAYFTRIDQVLRPPKHGVPAEVPDADALLVTLRQRAEEARKIEAPELCAEHHRQILALLDAGISLADRMRVLRDTKDQTALLGFAADRRALDDQEKQIDALAAELKQR
jgi:hypothetical protein